MVATKTAPAKKNTKAAKVASPGRAKKEGLRGPQVRILKALAKAKGPMSRDVLAAKAPVDVAACVEYIGSTDDAVRKANDAKHFPSLISLGLVKPVVTEESRAMAYEITVKGKTEAAKAE